MKTINLIDNSGIKGREHQYKTVKVNLSKIVKSWKASLFSFEWLTPEGNIKPPEQLSSTEAQKYHDVCEALEKDEELERPVLGIGMLDNIEIGSKRHVLLTLSAQGVEEMEVHIPSANEKDFNDYLC
ncbi:MAG: hypothetical protein MRY79_08100 [Alphaproteobacteria bacterium]|nr:hypothetical protein [Alphaproteobacteria bacterium]